jgi:phosphonate transport system ATP-binding protein
VFHQPEITSRYCTRVIGIKDGRVVYDGPPDLSEAQLKWLYGEELDSLRQEEPDPSGNGHPSDEDLPDIGKLIEG